MREDIVSEIGKDPRYEALLEAAARKGQDVMFEQVRLMFSTEFAPLIMQALSATESRIMTVVRKIAASLLSTDRKVLKMERILEDHARRFGSNDDRMARLEDQMKRITRTHKDTEREHKEKRVQMDARNTAKRKGRRK